jgi:hypothetical protein
MQFAENFEANWQEAYCFIMTTADPIQPKEPRREFKNYSGNVLKIDITARTWTIVTSISLVRYKTTSVAEVSLMTKRLKQRCGSGEKAVKRLPYCGFRRTGKAMGQVCQS